MDERPGWLWPELTEWELLTLAPRTFCFLPNQFFVGRWVLGRYVGAAQPLGKVGSSESQSASSSKVGKGAQGKAGSGGGRA